MKLLLAFVVILVIVGMLYLSYKNKREEAFVSALQEQTAFADRMSSFFHDKAENGIFIGHDVSLSGLNDAMRQPDMNLTEQAPTKDYTSYMIRDVSMEYTEKDKQFCRGAAEPRYLPARAAGSSVACGWWYMRDQNKISVGTLGTRSGPLFPETLPHGGEWMWNIDLAQQKEDIKLCKRVKTCDLLDVAGVKGRCGFCKHLGYAVPIKSDGSEKYPESEDGSCGAEVSKTTSACNRPEPVNVVTPDGVSCGTAGHPSPDNAIRLYNQAECDKLNGNFVWNGECLHKGGGSFSWDCRDLNAAEAAAVEKPPPGLCDPLPTGRLSKACLLSLVKGVGYTKQGGIYRMLYNGTLPEETDILAMKQLKLQGITVPKALLGDGSIDKESAGNIYKEIFDTISKGRTNLIREAAKWLTVGTDSFDICALDPKTTGPFELECVQRAFRQAGCQASGTAYPSSATMGAISNLTWGEINNTFTKLRDSMKSTVFAVQDKAARECLGVAFQRVPPRKCDPLPDRPAPVIKSSLPGLPQAEPRTITPTLPWDVVNAPYTASNTWSEMNRVCENKGKHLCSSTELCPSNQAIADMNIFGGVDNWMAVSDKPNEWVTYATFINNERRSRLCKTHTQVAGAVPAWGNTNNGHDWFRAAKCCPTMAPTQPWDVVNAPNTTTNTWNEMNQVCESKGKRLCNSKELCPSNQPIAELNIFSGADNWMAVNDKSNEWLTYNTAGGRLCKTHTQVANVLPGWGDSKGANAFYRAAKCCPK